MAHYDAQQKYSLEMFRSVIIYGQAALKSSILINGGAAVALMAFIGKIWGTELAVPAVEALTAAVLLFAFGVLASALGTGSTYVTQFSYMRDWNKTAMQSIQLQLTEDTRRQATQPQKTKRNSRR